MTAAAVIVATVTVCAFAGAAWLIQSARRRDRDLTDREVWARADAADRYTRFAAVRECGKLP